MNESLFGQAVDEVAPGAFHVPGWLDGDQQRSLLQACNDLMDGPVPMHSPIIGFGRKMSVRLVCAGLHWQPYKYGNVASNVNGAQVASMPEMFATLAHDALCATGYDSVTQNYLPDAALVNVYDETAKMGMHQDKDEKCSAPVVSLSLGNSCVFRFGNAMTRNKPYRDVVLNSGDLFVFGGASRYAFHGVVKTMANSAPLQLGLNNERINITIRQVYAGRQQ